MIVSVTLNPAVDQTLWVDRLEPGHVHRVRESQLDPAGKGINVSRMAHRLGWPTIAFGFLGGETGHVVQAALDEERVPAHFVPVPGRTRVNVTVVDGTRSSTSFYGPGPEITRTALDDLTNLMTFWLRAGRVLVLAGSVPPGVPPDVYAEMTRRAHAQGVKVILDADGEPLRLALAATPDLIKPNVEEAQRLLGRPLMSDDAVIAAAGELAARGVGTVIISMGGRGAVCAQRERAWRIHPPEVERRSTVGSGDAMVAGIAVALARGDDLTDALALGTAAGAATAMSVGTALGTAEDVAALRARVRLEEVH